MVVIFYTVVATEIALTTTVKSTNNKKILKNLLKSSEINKHFLLCTVMSFENWNTRFGNVLLKFETFKSVIKIIIISVIKKLILNNF